MSTPISRRTILAAAVVAPALAALPELSAAAATGTTILSSNLETAAVASPISVADMQTFLGDTSGVGNANNYAFTAVKYAAGRDKLSTKVLSQHLKQGTYGMPDAGLGGTGIAITGVDLKGAPIYEATIEYDVRFVGSGQWPFGGKLPGLGGILAGHGSNPPTGGNVSPYGWSGRLMHRRTESNNPTAPGKLVGYVYDPTQTGAGTYGQDRQTGVQLVWNRWYRVKQSFRMNNIVTEGEGRPDGIHRIWVDDQLVFEKTDQVFRLYAQAKITHYVHDLFLGGNDPAWSAPADLDVHIDNLLVTTP